MRREVAKLLFDALQACKSIGLFTHGKTLTDYLADPMLRSAVERQLMIVGEAVFRAAKDAPSLAGHISSLRQIVNLRHVLVHGYSAIQNETVWGMIQNELPSLLRELESLLPGKDEAGPSR